MECKRRAFVRGLGFSFLGLSTFLKACNRMSGEIQSKEEKMQTGQGTQGSAVPRKSIPPHRRRGAKPRRNRHVRPGVILGTRCPVRGHPRCDSDPRRLFRRDQKKSDLP